MYSSSATPAPKNDGGALREQKGKSMYLLQRRALIALAVTIGLVLLIASPALSQKGPVIKEPASLKKEVTFKGRLAKAADISEEKVEKILKALGPALVAELSSGNRVELAGIGTFRVVRISEHRDLVNGRPAVIPATNDVEFLPAQGMVDASNAPGAKAETTVPRWEFNPLGNEVPAVRQGNV